MSCERTSQFTVWGRRIFNVLSSKINFS